MTDITDIQRMEVRNTARIILDKPYDHSAPACELASFILATVEVHAPTLAEELAAPLAGRPSAERVVFDADSVCRLAARAGQIEKERADWKRLAEGHTAAIDRRDKYARKVEDERDDARAEVERRKFSMRKLREDQEEAWGEVERLRGQLKDAEDERDAVGDLMREQDTRISNQRQELARLNAEVERVRAVVDPEGAGLPPGMTISEAVQTLVDGIPTGEHEGLTAEQWKREYDLARDEVGRLTAEHLDRNPETKARVEAALNNLDQVEKVAVQKGAESNAETPDPADVKPGEAWLVEFCGEKRNAVKDGNDPAPWNTINAGGSLSCARNTDITLVARLVPAPRVITNPDELERLAATSIIRDGRGWPGGITDQGMIMVNGFFVSNEDILSYGPVTVLWEPEA